MNHLDIVKRLCDNNCDTYVVGGGIRDMLLGFNPEDFDVVTKATPEQVMELFKDCNVKTVGKSFGVVLVEGYEVATFRNDYYENGECKVRFAENIHDDLSRRDLTVNAMAYCELTGNLVDDHGGKQDLDSRLIKFVGNPDDRILEDPNRIIRACRFVAKIDGTFEYKTLQALKKHSKYLFNYNIAPERIRLEILKAMKIEKASKFFEALKLIGALEWIFPKLDECYKHPHGNYHTEDVFEHCMICGDSISTKDPILKLAGYLHDIGKPEAFTPVDQKFISHEIIGSDNLRQNLHSLTFSTNEINKICGLVKMHMNSIQKMTPKAIRKMLKRFNENQVNVKDFLRLRMADRKANLSRENFSLTEWKQMHKTLTTEAKQELPFSVHDLELKGGDIIRELDLAPGKLISDLQKRLLDFVVEEGKEFNKRDILLNEVKKYV